MNKEQATRFIVFEGIDGAGKTSLIAALHHKMIAHHHEVHVTAEPTKNHIGLVIRNMLTGKIEGDERTIAALFLADRLDHLNNSAYGMLQYLEKGSHVLCDRYYLSSYAYHVPHVSLDWVINANSICAELRRPDLTLFIDISVEESLKRLHSSRAALDRFENEDRIRQVRNNYFEAMEKVKNDENLVIIDGEKPLEAVFEEVWCHVKEIL